MHKLEQDRMIEWNEIPCPAEKNFREMADHLASLRIEKQIDPGAAQANRG